MLDTQGYKHKHKIFNIYCLTLQQYELLHEMLHYNYIAFIVAH
jgi:hypothetical protein